MAFIPYLDIDRKKPIKDKFVAATKKAASSAKGGEEETYLPKAIAKVYTFNL